MGPGKPYRGKVLLFLLPGLLLMDAVCLLLAHRWSAALITFIQTPIWAGVMWAIYWRSQMAPEWEETRFMYTARLVLLGLSVVGFVAFGVVVIHLWVLTPHR